MPSLKHFAHIQKNEISDPLDPRRLDRIYMASVPDVMNSLKSLKLETWSNDAYLPPQLREIRFRHYPEALYRIPEHFPKIMAIEGSLYPPETHHIFLNDIEFYVNLKSLHIVFGHIHNSDSLFKNLYNTLQVLPNMNSIVLEYPLEYFKKEPVGEEDDNNNGSANLLTDTEPSEHAIRIQNHLDECCQFAPIDHIKHLQIIGIELSIKMSLLQKLFPNAHIDYRRRFNQ